MNFANIVLCAPGYGGGFKNDRMDENFWKYGVGVVGAALIAFLGSAWNAIYSRKSTVDQLQFEQLKFILEKSKENIEELRTENEKLRAEIHLYSEQITELKNEVKRLREALGE